MDIRPLTNVEILATEQAFDNISYIEFIEKLAVNRIVYAATSGPDSFTIYDHERDVHVIALAAHLLHAGGLPLEQTFIHELSNTLVSFPPPSDFPPKPHLTITQNATGYAVAIEILELPGVVEQIHHELVKTGMFSNTTINNNVIRYLEGDKEPYYLGLRVHTPDNVYHIRYLDYWLGI